MTVRKYWPAAAVVLLALVASVTGLRNDYTYDDRFIVFMNPAVHSLHHWWRLFAQSYWPKAWTGDGYRPITILAFAIEWALHGGAPVVFHAANVLLYAVASLLVYRLALFMFPAWAAWLAAALFAVDPVHVEAVANVVGQSELLVAVALLGATILYLRDRRSGDLRPGTAVAILGLYAIASFAKEHGIVLPAILLAAELTIIGDERPWRERVRRLRPVYLALFAVALGFLAARSRVLADHSVGGFQLFAPFSSLKISTRDRILTAITVSPQWVRLLMWPAHLSPEYGPPALEIAQGFSITQIPGLMLLVAIIALGVVMRRRQPALSFGVATVCIALLPTSNFILPTGILIAERTMFLPSVGAAIVMGALAGLAADWIHRRASRRREYRVAALAACAALMVGGAYRSATRTLIWKDNFALFNQAARDEPDAYRTHFMLGAFDFDIGDRHAGEAEYRKALQLFPYDAALSFSLAEQYRMAGMCGPAMPLYKWTLTLDHDFPSGRTQYAACLLTRHDFAGARKWALEAVHVGGNAPALHRFLVSIDSAKKADVDRGMGLGASAGKSPSKVPDTMQKAVGSAQLPAMARLVKPLHE
jgi:hypothetical protein